MCSYYPAVTRFARVYTLFRVAVPVVQQRPLKKLYAGQLVTGSEVTPVVLEPATGEFF